jgi:hypothetical protein
MVPVPPPTSKPARDRFSCRVHYALANLSANIFSTVGTLVTIAVRLLELLFAVGLLGSAVVLVLSGIEDIETLMGSDDSPHH